jgi:hypothetical protein
MEPRSTASRDEEGNMLHVRLGMTSQSSSDQLPSQFPWYISTPHAPSYTPSHVPLLPFLLPRRPLSLCFVAVPEQRVLSRPRHQHGVHQAAQPSQATRIQICWCRQVIGVQIHPQTLLHQCRHQVLSNVHGVSSSIRFKCSKANLRLQAQRRMRDSLLLSHRLMIWIDHAEWLQLRHHQLPDHAVVQPEPRHGLSALGVLELGHRALPLPDFRCGRWHTSASNPSERSSRRALRSWSVRCQETLSHTDIVQALTRATPASKSSSLPQP